MNDNALKKAFSSKLDEILSSQTLPDDFCPRLTDSVRRLRWLRRLKLVIVVAIIASFSLAIFDYINAQRGLSPEKAQLVAVKQQQDSNPQLSKLAFLGFFRECFKRVKTTKRKEEEQ